MIERLRDVNTPRASKTPYLLHSQRPRKRSVAGKPSIGALWPRRARKDTKNAVGRTPVSYPTDRMRAER